MTREEIVYKLFGEPQEEKIRLYKPEIEEHLSKQTEKVTINVREVELEDPLKKTQDPTYLDDELLKFTDTGISILHATPKVTEKLRQYIPRTVKELTIPSTFLGDLSFLQEFPNLETLNISDYSTFEPEEVEYIANNTKIKNMTLRSSGTISGLKCREGCNVLDAGSMIAQYKNLTMYYKSYNGKWGRYLKVYTSDYSSKSLKTLESLYEGIKPHLPQLNGVTMTKDKEASIYDDFEVTIEDNRIKGLTIRNVSPEEASRVYKGIYSKENIDKTIINLDNKTYDDIYHLKQMSDTTEFIVRYHNIDEHYNDATYEEFNNMRATIDYYKELIETSDLSPVEKVAYVYDILKTMRYKENEEDKSRSRNIHAIVTDGNIVCVGYAAFAKQLLNELGIKCLNVGVTCKAQDGQDGGHARNIVRVDDDKYNIHGIFALDITWDNDKEVSIIEENGEKTIVSRPDEETKKKVVEQYDSLVLYRHFLIPMETYEQRYPEEENPAIYEAYRDGKAKKLTQQARKLARGEITRTNISDLYVFDQHSHLFSPEEGALTVERYFSEPKPTLETFEQILGNVRQAQGYTKDETKEEVSRVVELHQMLRNQNPDSPDNFFKPTTK